MNQRTLQQLLGGWNFALAFRRELSCTLNVCYVGAQRFPPRRVANLDGPLVDELLRVAFFSTLSEATYGPTWQNWCTQLTHPQLERDLVRPRFPVRLQLYDLCEEEGEHVRLDWKTTLRHLCCHNIKQLRRAYPVLSTGQRAWSTRSGKMLLRPMLLWPMLLRSMLLTIFSDLGNFSSTIQNVKTVEHRRPSAGDAPHEGLLKPERLA